MYSSLFSIYKWFDICIILWNDHRGKSSYHLPPYEGITVWLTVFFMLYIRPLWLNMGFWTELHKSVGQVGQNLNLDNVEFSCLWTCNIFLF